MDKKKPKIGTISPKYSLIAQVGVLKPSPQILIKKDTSITYNYAELFNIILDYLLFSERPEKLINMTKICVFNPFLALTPFTSPKLVFNPCLGLGVFLPLPLPSWFSLTNSNGKSCKRGA